jgi:probable F420-dependent oxidoreductase
VRFGLALPHYGFSLPDPDGLSWIRVRDWARRAEDYGFDSVWVSDHLFLDLSRYGGSDEPQPSLECFTALAGLAATTKKVRLGSLVVCNDLRSPALVAKMVATLDVLSKGRCEVALGAGWYEPEYRAAGIRFDPPAKRIERLAEAVQIVIGMLTEPSFSFSGRHYRVDDAWNLPRPIQSPRPPVWIGGKGDKLIRVAGRHADGYNTVWAWTPEMYRERIRLLDKSAVEAGRDPQTVRRSVGLYCLPGQDDSDLKKRWERYLSATQIQTEVNLEEWRSDKLAGTVEEIRARLRAFEELGVEEVILGFGLVPFQIADPSAVEWFAKEIMPL